MGNVDSTLQPSSEAQTVGSEKARQSAEACLQEHLSQRGFSVDALSEWTSSLDAGRESLVEDLAAAVQAGLCQLESDQAGELIRRVSVVEIEVVATLERGIAMLMEEERVFSDGYRQPWPCKPHSVFSSDETPLAAASKALQTLLGLSNEVVDKVFGFASCEHEALKASEREGGSDVEQAVALAFPGLTCCCSVHRVKIHLEKPHLDLCAELEALSKRIGLPNGTSFATSEPAACCSSGILGSRSCVHLWRWTPVVHDSFGSCPSMGYGSSGSNDFDLDDDQENSIFSTTLEDTHRELRMTIKQLGHHKGAFCQLGCMSEAALEEMQDRLRRVIQRLSDVDEFVHGVNVENVLAQITPSESDDITLSRNTEFRDFISSNFMESIHFETDLELKRRVARAKTVDEAIISSSSAGQQVVPRRFTVGTTDARACAKDAQKRRNSCSSIADDCSKETEGMEDKVRSLTLAFPVANTAENPKAALRRPDSIKIASEGSPRVRGVTFGTRQSFEATSTTPTRSPTPLSKAVFASEGDGAEEKDAKPEPVPEGAISLEAKAIKASNGHQEWVCDAQSISDQTKGAALQVIAEVFLLPQVEEFGTSTAVMRRFISALHGAYLMNLNPFHNETHVALVTHATRFLASGGPGWNAASVVEKVAMDVATLSHDAGHFGRNNAFCINTRHWLALTYNDRSVLENMHAATCFQLMQAPDRNILSNLTKENTKLFREHVIDLILATDMASHFEFLGQFKVALGRDDFDPENERRDRELVTRCCVKAADLGHTALPWDLHEPWVLRLLTEFYEQGDQERQLGYPVSPMCSRSSDITEFQKSQKGFLQFLVTPLYAELKRVQLHIDVHEVCISRIEKNAARWVEELPSLELIAVVTGKPQEGEDGTTVSPEIAVQKRPTLQYLPVSRAEERHQVFKPGDQVWIIKESRMKGKRATVLDPCWKGLVKVYLEDQDKGNIKSYQAFELQLAVATAVAEL